MSAVVSVVVLAAVAFLPSPAAAQEEQDPFSLGDAFPPRVVVIDLPAPPVGDPVGSVSLFDAAGREIPLTGAGVEVSGSRLRVFPPRLPAGTYTLVHPGGSSVVEVGEAPVVPSFGGDGGRGRLWMLPLVFLVPGLVLLVRGRRLAGVLVGLAGGGVSVGLFLLGAPGAALPQGDPCAGRADLTACATGYVVGVLEDFGPATATDELVRLASAPGSAWARICHEPAHELGMRTWLADGSLDRAVEAGTTSCSLGYVHGLLQAMGTYLGDDEFPAAARDLCDGLDRRYRSGDLVGGVSGGPSTLLGCHHGVGHAAMWRFNEDLNRASPTCAGFALTEQVEECRVGAVMEWVYASQRAARSGVAEDRPSPQVARPVELCLPPLGALTPGCVEGAVTAVGPDGIEATRAWCVEHPGVLAACVQSLARRMVQMELSAVAPLLATVPDFCSSFGAAYGARECAERFGYMLLFLGRDASRTDGFCASLPGEMAAGCTKGARDVLEYARQTGDESFNLTDR